MPNPNPTRRARSVPESLPSGFDRRKDGRLRYRWSDGGVRQPAIYGWTTDECYRKRYDSPPPTVRISADTTLADYLRLWTKNLDGRPNTNRQHRAQVDEYLVPLFGERTRLAELDRDEVKQRFAELRDRPGRRGRILAPRTIALVHATLRRALNQAVDDGRIKANPALRVNPNATTGSGGRARRVGVELAIPSPADIRRLRAVTEGEPFHALLILATLTGLRQGEALGLGWDGGVDLEGRWIHVHRSLRRTDAVLDDPKTESSNRYVPFPAMLVPILRAHRRDQVVAQLAAGKRWNNTDDLVFTDSDGAPVHGWDVSHWFADACRRAGIRHYRWHDLRHAYASGLINAGVDLSTVSKRMGHASYSITSDIYHHLVRSDEQETAEVAARVFG